jgi:hypothetical protein
MRGDGCIGGNVVYLCHAGRLVGWLVGCWWLVVVLVVGSDMVEMSWCVVLCEVRDCKKAGNRHLPSIDRHHCRFLTGGGLRSSRAPPILGECIDQ